MIIRAGHVYFPDRTVRLADVRVRDGRITEIGPGLPGLAGEEVVDASGGLVLPGFVDAHRHMWLGGLSASASGVPLFAYAQQVNEGRGDRFTADDIYAGVLWGAVQALNAGVTTVADWAHNVGSLADADANLSALADSGIRARFFFGGKASSSGDYSRYEAQARALHAAPTASGRISLGLALRGPSMTPPDVTEREFALARELVLPISIHAGMAGLPGAIDQLHRQGLLGKDVNYVHANEFSPAEWELIAATGGTVSSTPTVEMTMGLGTHPAIGPAWAHGVPAGLGADTVAYGPGDLFGEMRLVLAAERSRTNTAAIRRGEMPGELGHDHLDVLDVATRGGASVLGLADDVGAIALGRRADLVVVGLTAPHLDGLDDPVLSAFLNAGPSDVDTVIVEGRILKRHGRIVGEVLDRARALLRESRERIASRVGPPAQ